MTTEDILALYKSKNNFCLLTVFHEIFKTKSYVFSYGYVFPSSVNRKSFHKISNK